MGVRAHAALRCPQTITHPSTTAGVLRAVSNVLPQPCAASVLQHCRRCAGTSWQRSIPSCAATPTWRPSGASPGCLERRTQSASGTPSASGQWGVAVVWSMWPWRVGQGLRVRCSAAPRRARSESASSRPPACAAVFHRRMEPMISRASLHLVSLHPCTPLIWPQVCPAALPLHTLPARQRYRRSHYAPPVLRVPH